MKLVKALQEIIFTDHSKAVLPMWIIYFLSCACYAFVLVCLVVPCVHLLGKR